MDIVFKTKKLEKEFNNQKSLEKSHGQKRAKRIRQRLDDLRDVNNLAEMRQLPGRCHELTQDRQGQLALDLDHPYRLIFEPANEPIPTKEDGGLDWSKVTTVKILEIDDYH
jgi:proteic killer suppression protein